MTYRKTVTKVIYEAEGSYGNKDQMPENLGAAVEWLQEKLDSLPEDMREDAILEIEAERDYDCAVLKIKIEGRRPETDAEQMARLGAEARHRFGLAMTRELQERAAYEALRKKYGDKS
ncbi:hypothetical protein [Bosea sp. LjRoot237]|uniref:hypothetical protein n=1 Tax=Bosea sp. LjRoot237 TaxID=3342292 RepID=UPI003ECF32FA